MVEEELIRIPRLMERFLGEHEGYIASDIASDLPSFRIGTSTCLVHRRYVYKKSPKHHELCDNAAYVVATDVQRIARLRAAGNLSPNLSDGISFRN